MRIWPPTVFALVLSAIMLVIVLVQWRYPKHDAAPLEPPPLGPGPAGGIVICSEPGEAVLNRLLKKDPVHAIGGMSPERRREWLRWYKKELAVEELTEAPEVFEQIFSEDPEAGLAELAPAKKKEFLRRLSALAAPRMKLPRGDDHPHSFD